MNSKKSIINISKEVKEDIEKLLNLSGDKFRESEICEGEVIHSFTAYFDDCKCMDISLTATDCDFYLNVVLFKGDTIDEATAKFELCCLDPEYELSNKFEIEYEGIKYVAEIVVGDELVFKEYTIEQFNEKYQINATEKMNIEEFADYIETKDLRYIYISYCNEDVIANCKEFISETNNKCEFLIVNGMYMGLY